MDERLRQRINELINRFRNGDKEAEELLQERYKRRIKLYVYRNVWSQEIKDLDDLIEIILFKLFKWFINNYIVKSEKSVIYNLVRRECASQGKKDKREPLYGVEPFEADSKNDSNNGSNLPIHKEILNSVNVIADGDPDCADKMILFKVSFYSILSKCLKPLSERQQKALHHRFFLDRTYKEIGQSLNTSNVTALKDCKSGLESLRKCLNKHGIFSTGDLL